MSDIDKLVENYFASTTKTLTKQMLCEIIEEVVEAVQEAGGSVIDGISKLEPEKKKRFIKLICKVKGIETYSGQKTIRDDINVSAEDVELVIKEVLGIDLTVENIHV